MKKPESWKSIHAMKRRSPGESNRRLRNLSRFGTMLPLPVITAFRLLASRIAPRHPILLKDVSRNRGCSDGGAEELGKCPGS